MIFNDSLFNKIEKRTKVDKDTIYSLAKKLQNGNMQDEKTIREIIDTLSSMTNRKVTKEQSDKIVARIIDGKVPGNVDKFF